VFAPNSAVLNNRPTMNIMNFIILANVKDQTRPQLARSVLLGAQSVTAVVVVCIAWFGSVVFITDFPFGRKL